MRIKINKLKDIKNFYWNGIRQCTKDYSVKEGDDYCIVTMHYFLMMENEHIFVFENSEGKIIELSLLLKEIKKEK